MKRKVYTDGNGGTSVLIEGLGAYVPQPELYELKAQVELLRNAAIQALHADDIEDEEDRASVFDKLNDAVLETPAQCLAEIKARGIMEALDYAKEKCSTYLDVDFYVMEYANLLTESAKGE